MTTRFFVKGEVRVKIFGSADAALETAILAQGYTLSQDTGDCQDGFDPSERCEEGTRELNADGTYTVHNDRYNHSNRMVKGHRYDKGSWSKCSPEELAASEAKRVEAEQAAASKK